MATIYDIAKHCNISAATVSYVLNGHGNARRISIATQDNVLKAAQELGYKRIRSTRSSNIVITIYWLQKELEMIMPGLINGINAVMSSEISPIDVSIRPFLAGHLSDQETLWEKSSSDAAIVIGANSEDLVYLEHNLTHVPTVLFNRDLSGYTSVTVDHDEAGRLIAQHAISKGGSDLALILNPASLFGLNSRGKAIINTCQEHGIDMKKNLFYCDNGIDDGYELGWEMIRKKQLKKVIICVYDITALGIISALNEAKISVGDEVQIIATSSGPSRLFARSTPPLTVVDLQFEETARRALKMAIELGSRRITTPQKIVIPPTLIYRQSCPMGNIEL